MTDEIRDITIIGGGPTGLFAAFYAGMRGVSSRIVDALPELGGQLVALYPEKYIFDVAGFPKILAKELVRGLAEQMAQFSPAVCLNQRVVALEEDGETFTLVTETDHYPSRAILIAAGIGAFAPRRLPQPCAGPWYDRGIYDRVTDPERFRGQRVLIIGGGDSAFDWAQQLLERAARSRSCIGVIAFGHTRPRWERCRTRVAPAVRVCSPSTSSWMCTGTANTCAG